MLALNCVKSLRVPKTVDKIKVADVYIELVAKICFQIQSQRKHLRQTLVFM